MTDAEQFATEFLGVQPESFPVHINLKITGELLDAYLAHIEKKKADNILNVSNIPDGVFKSDSPLLIDDVISDITITEPSGKNYQLL